MVQADAIYELIKGSIEEVNETLPEDKQVGVTIDTALYGRSAQIESLTLVSIIAAVEERIEDEFEAPISLTDEKALSRTNSPFQSVQTLVAYVEEALAHVPT